MIPAIRSNAKPSNIVISTGNILNVNKTPERKSSEELLDGLKLTLECGKELDNVHVDNTNGRILRASHELCERISEHARSNISIGAKIFLNKSSNTCVRGAVRTLLHILKVEQVDNVVLAYHPKADVATPPAMAAINGESYGVLKWNSKDDGSIAELKALWTALEECALQKQILQLGISDLDMDTLSELHATARVHPSIAQISLTSCCVVPPSLQDFCNNHDIQLLTHSDPEVLLDNEQFPIPGYSVEWVVRYQVHVRCRGVLTAKGYIVGATKDDDTV